MPTASFLCLLRRRSAPIFAALAFSAALGSAATAADAPRASLDGVVALKGAKIHTVAGGVIENGVIVIRDGLIESVGGEGHPVPFDAEVIDGQGLVAYPGFVDAGTDAGIDAELEKKRKETAPGGYGDAARDVVPEMPRDSKRGIFPDVDATELLKTEAATFAPHREAGFVAGEVAPKRGAIRGFGAVLSFVDTPGAEGLRGPASLHLAFDYSGGGYPSTLFGVIAHLRQTFFDARRYEADLADYERREMKGRRRPPADAGLARLGANGAPVVFEADTHEDIHRALRLAEELDLPLRVGGGAEAWRSAARLRERNVPVLLDLAVKEEPTKKDAAKKASEGGDSGGGPGDESDCCLADFAMTSGAALEPVAAEPQQQLGQQPGQEEESPPPAPRGRRGRRDGGEGTAPAGAGPASKESAPSDEKGAAGEKSAKPPLPWEAAEKKRDEIREAAVFAEDHAEWEESVKGPSVLAETGVRFAFRTGSATDKKKALGALRTFVENGLPKDAALRALTLEPARLLGVDAQLGTIEPGKLASLALFSGDLFDKESEVRYVFVEGKKFAYAPKKKKPEAAGENRDGKEGGGGGEAAAPASVAGKWEATAKSSMGEFQFELVLEQSGATVTGKLVSKQFGREFGLEGTMTGSAFEATVTMDFGGNSAEIRIEATVDGAAMTGSSSSAFSEEESEFSAKRTSGPEKRS